MRIAPLDFRHPSVWQGRRDSNTQPTVLETATLPLSHSPVRIVLYTIKNISSSFYSGIRAKNLTFSTQFCTVRFCAPLAADVTPITIPKAEKKVNDRKMNNMRKAAPRFPNTIRERQAHPPNPSRKFQQRYPQTQNKNGNTRRLPEIKANQKNSRHCVKKRSTMPHIVLLKLLKIQFS